MPSPTLRQLRALLATVQTGSVSAAARALNITQPAASQQLRELERICGMSLIERVAGRMQPTATGEALLVHARNADRAVEELMATAAVYRGGDNGRVRIGTGATACIYLLPEVLTRMKRRMPALEIIIATGNTPEILRDLEDGRLDVALVTLPTPLGRSLTARRLRSDPLLGCLPAALAEENRLTVLRPAQLARMPLILYERGGRTRAVVDSWFRRAGLSPQPIMELGSVEAIKVLVASGLGATLLPSLALRRAVPGISVLPLRPNLARSLGLVMRREKRRDRGLRLFLDEIERGPMPPADA